MTSFMTQKWGNIVSVFTRSGTDFAGSGIDDGGVAEEIVWMGAMVVVAFVASNWIATAITKTAMNQANCISNTSTYQGGDRAEKACEKGDPNSNKANYRNSDSYKSRFGGR